MVKTKIAKTSNKKILQITAPDYRFYKVKGKYYPSSTYILNSYPKDIGFYKWLASKNWDEAERIKEEAGNRGSKVHNAIYDLIKGKKIKASDRYWNDTKNIFEPLTNQEWYCLLTFQNWWKDKNPQVIASEIVCYSEKYGYAGTIDFIGVVDNEVVLIDWKTGSRIYRANWCQVGSYHKAELETGKYKPAKVGILRLGTRHRGKDGNGVGYEYKTMNLTKTEKKFRVFLAVKKIWLDGNPKMQPDFKEIPASIKIKVVKLKKKYKKKKHGK